MGAHDPMDLYVHTGPNASTTRRDYETAGALLHDITLITWASYYSSHYPPGHHDQYQYPGTALPYVDPTHMELRKHTTDFTTEFTLTLDTGHWKHLWNYCERRPL